MLKQQQVYGKYKTKLYTIPGTLNTIGTQSNYSIISSNDVPTTESVTMSNEYYVCNNVTFQGFTDYTYKPDLFSHVHIITPHTDVINALPLIPTNLYFNFIFKSNVTDTDMSTEYIAMYYPSISKLFNNEVLSLTDCKLKHIGDGLYVTSDVRFYETIQSSYTQFRMPLIALVNRISENGKYTLVNSTKQFELHDIALVDYDNAV